jgi:hypothetical protein
LRSLVARQFEVTGKILDEAEADARTHLRSLNLAGSGLTGMGTKGSGTNDRGWYKEMQIHFKAGPEGRRVVGLWISGESRDLRTAPIVVEDRGGELNSKIIDRLVRAYREKGWPFRIETSPVAAD